MFYAARDDDDGNLYTEDELDELYAELLDESGEVTIGSLSYTPSQVLAAVDPIAYRVGFADYTSEFEEVAFDSFENFEAAKDGE
jgi:hypothetical protein